MILLVVVASAVILLALGLWAAAGERRPRAYAIAAAIPLLLTVVVPLPFSFERPAGWARTTAVAITWVGIAASCVFFAIGIVLAIAAVVRDNRRAAIAFAAEAFVAGLPAALFGVYALINR